MNEDSHLYLRRLFSLTFVIMGPVVLAINTGLIADHDGVYPPPDFFDMAFAALLTLGGWAQLLATVEMELSIEGDEK